MERGIVVVWYKCGTYYCARVDVAECILRICVRVDMPLVLSGSSE